MADVDEESYIAFPKLSTAEVEHLAELAELCEFEDGETIFEAGQRGVPLYVVESGLIAIVDDYSTDEPKTVVVHSPREFTGDVSLLTDRPTVIAAYARGATRAYCVSQSELRRVIQEIPELSDKLLEAFQARQGHSRTLRVRRSPRLRTTRRPRADGHPRVLRQEQSPAHLGRRGSGGGTFRDGGARRRSGSVAVRVLQSWHTRAPDPPSRGWRSASA